MGHVVGRARVPLRAVDRPPRQGLHGHGRDELGGGLGHHHLHAGPGLDEQPGQLGALVAGHAAAQAQDDVFALQFIHGRAI